MIVNVRRGVFTHAPTPARGEGVDTMLFAVYTIAVVIVAFALVAYAVRLPERDQ